MIRRQGNSSANHFCSNCNKAIITWRFANVLHSGASRPRMINLRTPSRPCDTVKWANFTILFKTKHFAVIISLFPTSKRSPWQANYLVERNFQVQNSSIALNHKWRNIHEGKFCEFGQIGKIANIIPSESFLLSGN